MREHHASAAVPFEAKSIEGVTLRKAVVLEKRQIGRPLVANDLTARETAYRDNHG